MRPIVLCGALIVTMLLGMAAGVSADRAEWILTSDEITESRGGRTREDIKVVTEGNDMEPLVDGQTFMARLYADFEAAGSGDFIHGEAFDELAEVIMLPSPNQTNYQNTEDTFGNTLIRALHRGVTVRILANLNSYYLLNAAKFCHVLNPICNKIQKSDCCVPDLRHYSQSGSVHNKLWVIKLGNDTVGYTGGMDITAGRYDTRTHSNDALRKVQPPLGVRYAGWHDTMYRTRGPAVIDMARDFQQRWNDPAPAAPTYTTEPFAWVEPPVDPAPGTLDVQLVRTLSCRAAVEQGYYREFAPRGEYSIRDLFKKMVGNAKEYLYLADQFVYYPEIIDIVAQALPRLKALIIMTDSAHSWTISLPAGIKVTQASQMRMYYQYQAMQQLKEPIDGKSYGEKVHVYELVRPGGDDENPEDLIYVHAKVYLADDNFAILGSAGLERAAFTGDVDVSFGVYDSVGGGPDSFVGRLRRNLWAEHLGTSPEDPELRDPIKALDMWERKADNPEWRVRRYWPTEVKKKWFTSFLYEFFEADGSCPAPPISAPSNPSAHNIPATATVPGVRPIPAKLAAALTADSTDPGSPPVRSSWSRVGAIVAVGVVAAVVAVVTYQAGAASPL